MASKKKKTTEQNVDSDSTRDTAHQHQTETSFSEDKKQAEGVLNDNLTDDSINVPNPSGGRDQVETDDLDDPGTKNRY